MMAQGRATLLRCHRKVSTARSRPTASLCMLLGMERLRWHHRREPSWTMRINMPSGLMLTSQLKVNTTVSVPKMPAKTKASMNKTTTTHMQQRHMPARGHSTATIHPRMVHSRVNITACHRTRRARRSTPLVPAAQLQRQWLPCSHSGQRVMLLSNLCRPLITSMALPLKDMVPMA